VCSPHSNASRAPSTVIEKRLQQTAALFDQRLELAWPGPRTVASLWRGLPGYFFGSAIFAPPKSMQTG
jgi:hypothetical protein